MQAISRGSRKRILIFNTNENSPNDPIVVVSPETYGGTSDSAVPVVVAYNGGHYVSLHPVGDESIEKTQQLCQQYIDGTYPYKRKDIGKLTSAYTSAEKKQRSRNKERLSLIENLITKTITAGGGGGVPTSYYLSRGSSLRFKWTKFTLAFKQSLFKDPTRYGDEKKKRTVDQRQARQNDKEKYDQEKKKKTVDQRQARQNDREKYSQEKKRIVEQRSVRNKNKLITEIESDTGFESICCVCCQFHSSNNTVNIDTLEEADLVKYACISDKTKEIDGTFSVCRQCKNDIEKKEAPKKSQNLDLFDFPSEFIDHAVKMLGNLDVKLNKLEGFLLKLVIPFIR